MKDKRQRMAFAWPYAAVYTDPAFAASILQCAAAALPSPHPAMYHNTAPYPPRFGAYGPHMGPAFQPNPYLPAFPGLNQELHHQAAGYFHKNQSQGSPQTSQSSPVQALLQHQFQMQPSKGLITPTFTGPLSNSLLMSGPHQTTPPPQSYLMNSSPELTDSNPSSPLSSTQDNGLVIPTSLSPQQTTLVQEPKPKLFQPYKTEA